MCTSVWSPFICIASATFRNFGKSSYFTLTWNKKKVHFLNPIFGFLMITYLTAVHKIQKTCHMITVDIRHEQNRMRRRMFKKYLLKVRAAHWQNLNKKLAVYKFIYNVYTASQSSYQFMSFENFSTSRYGHVNHFLVLLQAMKTFAHISMKIVPR